MKRGAVLAVAGLALAVLAAAVAFRSRAPGCFDTAGAPATLFRVARIFDGHALIAGTDVVVVSGMVAGVGTIRCVEAHGAEVREVDRPNATLLPGLIDAHVHGSDHEEQLAAALSFGVTTEVDMGGATPARLAEIRAKNDSALADAIGAGMYVTAPGGHGTEYGHPVPTLAGAGDAAAFVDARVDEGSAFIKLIISSGMPTLDAGEATAVVGEAHRRGRLVVTHVNTRRDAEVAVGAGVDGLAHLFNDRKEGQLRDGSPVGWDQLEVQRLVETMAQRHIFVIPTLQMLQMACGIAAGVTLLKDDRVAPRLTESERRALAAKPWGAGSSEPACYEHVLKTMELVHGQVTILAGTDAPNEGAIHGASLHRELELLVEAGLSPTEALRSATSAPAETFEQLRDRGRISLGVRADLLLVDGDPTQDIRATRALVHVYKRGVQAR
jgi:imidazolonepropionase-like amidohydrolase